MVSRSAAVAFVAVIAVSALVVLPVADADPDDTVGASSLAGGFVIVGGHVVTFSPCVGVGYEIVDRDEDSVSFKVVGERGLTIDPSTVEVAIEGGVIQPVNGVYTLDGIVSDTMVSIDGEPYYSANPGDVPDVSPFPLWIVLLALAAVFAFAAAVVWKRGRDLESGHRN